ncbi:MAG: tetratricopeptide repeat protein, partial [Fidelibacterota bacterium]
MKVHIHQVRHNPSNSLRSFFAAISLRHTIPSFALLLIVAFLAGCARPGEIPITTKSDKARQIYLDARDAFENVRANEARLLCSKAARLDPKFALAYLCLARATDDINERNRSLVKAIALVDKVSYGERLIIEAFHANLVENDRVTWARKIRQLARRFPEDKQANNELGNVYRYYYDDHAKAIRYYNKAIAIDSAYAPPYNNLGYAYRADGQYDLAERAFRDYIRLIPDQPNPYDSMGDLLTKMGHFEEANEYYRQAIDRNPTFSFSQRKIGFNLGYLGRYQEGQAAILDAVDMTVTPPTKVVEMIFLGFYYVERGLIDEALAQFDVCIQTATEKELPQFQIGFHLNKGDIYRQTNQYDLAEQSYAAGREVLGAVELPNLESQIFERIITWREAYLAALRDNFDSAFEIAGQLEARIKAERTPDDMRNIIYPLLGMINLEQENYEEAIKHFRKSNPENPFILYYFALALDSAGHAERAQEY